MNVTQLNAISRLFSTNPNEAKALVKLASIEVLTSLGSKKYSISLNSKQLNAQSEKTLLEGSKYWTQFTQTKNQTPTLSKLLKMPSIMKELQLHSQTYSTKELLNLFKSNNPEKSMKNSLLEKLTTATNKEEFSANSNLLLSLQNSVFTIPLNFHNYFSILQFKKRYNKKTKKSHIDFYAALEFLGPVSGIISLENSDIKIVLHVAFAKTEEFLQNEIKNFSYDIEITLVDTIEPLFESHINSLLDINV